MKNSYIIKRLYKFIKPYKKRFILALVSISFVSALNPSLLSMIKPVMDGIFTADINIVIPVVNIVIPRIRMLYYFAIIIMSIALLKGVFDYISKYYMAYIGQSVTKHESNVGI